MFHYPICVHHTFLKPNENLYCVDDAIAVKNYQQYCTAKPFTNAFTNFQHYNWICPFSIVYTELFIDSFSNDRHRTLIPYN